MVSMITHVVVRGCTMHVVSVYCCVMYRHVELNRPLLVMSTEVEKVYITTSFYYYYDVLNFVGRSRRKP